MAALETKHLARRSKIRTIFDYLSSCHYNETKQRYEDTTFFDDQLEAESYGHILQIKMSEYENIGVEIKFKTVRLFLMS